MLMERLQKIFQAEKVNMDSEKQLRFIRIFMILIMNSVTFLNDFETFLKERGYD